MTGDCAAERPMNNVYQVHFLDIQLPESLEDKVKFSQDYARDLTRAEPDQITCLIQPSNVDPSCRITIAIPQRLTSVVERVESSGLSPVFTEPESPYVEDDHCFLPAIFQIRHFGGVLHPRMVADHPARLEKIAEAIRDEVPGLPEVAKDWRNWNKTMADTEDENSVFVIYWGDHEPEEEWLEYL